MTDFLDLNPRSGEDTDDEVRAADYDEYRRQVRELNDERLYEHRPVRPYPKPQPRLRRSAANKGDAPGLWRDAVLNRDQGCRVHENPADCQHGWAAHHVVLQQTLRDDCPDALWNPLSGMGVCGLAHRQHHNRRRPILLHEIPPVVVAYLQHHGFGPYLDRHYPLTLDEL